MYTREVEAGAGAKKKIEFLQLQRVPMGQASAASRTCERDAACPISTG